MCLKTHEGKGAAVVLGSHHLVIHSFIKYLLSPVYSIRDKGTLLVDRTLGLLFFWNILIREYKLCVQPEEGNEENKV